MIKEQTLIFNLHKLEVRLLLLHHKKSIQILICNVATSTQMALLSLHFQDDKTSVFKHIDPDDVTLASS